jgi:two-component system, chemotaxis family, response regulator Rcp1
MSLREVTPRILVVEDSEADVELLREVLADAGQEVELAVCRLGEDALTYLHEADGGRGERPHLVVLDLNLPRMSGLEVLEALRSDADPELRRMPVIVFTTSKAQSDILSAYDLHASSFVTKPTAYEQYVDTVGAMREFWLRAAELPAQG